MKFGLSHVDGPRAWVYKVKVPWTGSPEHSYDAPITSSHDKWVTLRLTKDNAHAIASALEHGVQASGRDHRGREWTASRYGITHDDYDSKSHLGAMTGTATFTDDWGRGSWQGFLATMKEWIG